MKFSYVLKMVYVCVSLYSFNTKTMVVAEDGLKGLELLEGIRNIIGVDPNVSPEESHHKPFVGSFSTIHTENDPSLENTTYCMTDNACGRWDAYSRPDVPLDDLYCNSFCFIDITTKKYTKSKIYDIQNPPLNYLNCGWETCG